MISLLTGNSRVLLAVDENGDWLYLYYPYAGQFQHLLESRRGIYDVEDGSYTWVGGEGWEIDQGYEKETNVGWTLAQGNGLEVHTKDMVHPDRNLVLRAYEVRNLESKRRELRLFHYQSMSIAESLYQDTCYWDQSQGAIVHYKRDYYLQLWGEPRFNGFTCGEHTLKGLQGSHVDAEDGNLEGNTISHGATDSVVQWNLDVPAEGSASVWLLLLLAESRRRINEAYRRLQKEAVDYRERETVNFWKSWFDGKRIELPADLSPRAKALYNRSLFVLRNCWNANGSIIASPDVSSLMPTGDTYNYNWWRDGAYISMAMDRAGLYESAHKFLVFARESQEEEGYFFHRHFPDGTPGATWHPPPFLQIDQTASVITAAWHHFVVNKDMEFLLNIWPMVREAADFLVSFQDKATALPLPSFDLWEEVKSVNCYSAAAVAQGLQNAESISEQLGKSLGGWGDMAERMRQAILEHFWDDERGLFLKSIKPEDEVPDSSTLLTIRCGILPVEDPRARVMVEKLKKELWSSDVGGMARYEGDDYYGHQNPWIICTLWLADVYMRMGEWGKAKDLVEWCAERTTPTLLLPEQVKADTGRPVSVIPLVWSHATYVDAVVSLSKGAGVRAR
ncbi:MAG: glycoside hydrolase family 15 protein [Thermoplasmata archaeon]